MKETTAAFLSALLCCVPLVFSSQSVPPPNDVPNNDDSYNQLPTENSMPGYPARRPPSSYGTANGSYVPPPPPSSNDDETIGVSALPQRTVFPFPPYSSTSPAPYSTSSLSTSLPTTRTTTTTTTTLAPPPSTTTTTTTPAPPPTTTSKYQTTPVHELTTIENDSQFVDPLARNYVPPQREFVPKLGVGSNSNLHRILIQVEKK